MLTSYEQKMRWIVFSEVLVGMDVVYETHVVRKAGESIWREDSVSCSRC